MMKWRVTMKESDLNSHHSITWINLTGHKKTQQSYKNKVLKTLDHIKGVTQS